MNKKDLIATVAKKTKLKTAEAAKAVEAVFDTVMKEVSKGNDVRLIGFGSFTSIKRKARQGRNPRTGAALKIPAKKLPKFKAGKEFREAVS